MEKHLKQSPWRLIVEFHDTFDRVLSFAKIQKLTGNSKTKRNARAVTSYSENKTRKVGYSTIEEHKVCQWDKLRLPWTVLFALKFSTHW